MPKRSAPKTPVSFLRSRTDEVPSEFREAGSRPDEPRRRENWPPLAQAGERLELDQPVEGGDGRDRQGRRDRPCPVPGSAPGVTRASRFADGADQNGCSPIAAGIDENRRSLGIAVWANGRGVTRRAGARLHHDPGGRELVAPVVDFVGRRPACDGPARAGAVAERPSGAPRRSAAAAPSRRPMLSKPQAWAF